MPVLNGWCDEAPAGFIEPHTALFLKNASEGAKQLLKEGKLKTLQELSAAAPDTLPIACPPRNWTGPICTTGCSPPP
jgi:hypothetical protein